MDENDYILLLSISIGILVGCGIFIIVNNGMIDNINSQLAGDTDNLELLFGANNETVSQESLDESLSDALDVCIVLDSVVRGVLIASLVTTIFVILHFMCPSLSNTTRRSNNSNSQTEKSTKPKKLSRFKKSDEPPRPKNRFQVVSMNIGSNKKRFRFSFKRRK